jgi:putative peptide zinc metalloprotease protein
VDAPHGALFAAGVLVVSVQDAQGQAFSDAWHRVAQVRLRLRTSVRAHRQHFRGEAWVVLRDTLSSEHYRTTPLAYAWLSQLDGQCSVDEAWSAWMDRQPEEALTQEEVVQLLGQLHMANLLQFDRGQEGHSLFERFTQRRRRERWSQVMGFLAIKLPLLDPDVMLERALPLIRLIFSPWGLLAYLALLLAGAKAVVDNADELWAQSQGILAVDNLLLLYVGMALAKTVHEFGHAAACKRYGGEVHKMGVMLLIFAPLPYMDATASWGFRRRGERLLVAASGVISELAVAAVAALVWANTAPGTLHALAYNVIFVASVSTLLFNLNPLLRFDGYHMLVDVLDMPNLYQRSREQLKYLGQRLLLGVKQAQPAARSSAESWWLPIYGVVSLGYWLVLMSGIVFFIAKTYLDVGKALAVFLLVTALGVPLFKLLRYLFSSPQLLQRRAAVWARVGALAALLVVGVGLWPVAQHVRVDGVVQAKQFRHLFNDSAGRVQAVLAQPGAEVQAGEALVQLRNDGLDFEIAALQRQLQQLEAQELQALAQAVANVAPLRRQREAVALQLADMQRQREALLVRAPLSGRWAATELAQGSGQWLPKGGRLGTVLDEQAWRFVAVLPQVATHVFQRDLLGAEVRVFGREQDAWVVTDTEVRPFEQGQLPSAALGLAGGGAIAVDPQDPQGLQAVEPFFQVQADLPAATSADLRHGQRGVMRLQLPPAPLWQQWSRGMRQFLQREFRV